MKRYRLITGQTIEPQGNIAAPRCGRACRATQLRSLRIPPGKTGLCTARWHVPSCRHHASRAMSCHVPAHPFHVRCATCTRAKTLSPARSSATQTHPNPAFGMAEYITPFPPSRPDVKVLQPAPLQPPESSSTGTSCTCAAASPIPAPAHTAPGPACWGSRLSLFRARSKTRTPVWSLARCCFREHRGPCETCVQRALDVLRHAGGISAQEII